MADIVFTDRPQRGRRAFTMLEIVLAVVLLGLAVIPMVGLMQSETRRTSLNRNRIFANHLATNIVERFRMEDPRLLAQVLDDREASQVYLSELELLNPTPGDAGFAALFPRFRRYAWVEKGSGVDEGKYVLKVAVEWDEKGLTRKVLLDLLLVMDSGMGW